MNPDSKLDAVSLKTASRRSMRGWRSVVLLLAAIVLLPLSIAIAQQNQPPPPPQLMPNQGNKGGSTLELPTVPRQQGNSEELPSIPRQGGESNTIPPITQQPQALTLPSRELRTQPGYQQVTVTVTDSSGRYVTNLQKDDFRLFMDGQQRPIEFFRQDLNTPVSVGILVDTSGSMEPKIVQARRAIAQFLQDLNDKDDVFLFAFSTHPFLLQPFTTDKGLVMDRLRLLHAFGETSIYDTVLLGLKMVKKGKYDKKALLLVTDGMDNTSLASLDQVTEAARRAGVLIYSIGIGDPNASDSLITIGPFVVAGGGIERVDGKTLHTLSNETGAKTYIIQRVGDGEVLRKACEQISLELREQYTLGFVTPNPTAGGYRSLSVDVPTHPGVDSRVRKGVDASNPTYASDPGGP